MALVTIVPSAPGYAGTFELTAVEIAKLFGIDPASGLAMGLLVHAMILGITSIGGVMAFIVGRRRRVAAETPGTAGTGGAG